MAFVNLGQVVWPVGAIYMSSSSVSSASLFGGTWKKIDDDRFWLPSNTSLAYGGESTHTLTINEMPNHAHKHFMNAADEAPSASYWIPGNALVVDVQLRVAIDLLVNMLVVELHITTYHHLELVTVGTEPHSHYK